MNKAITLKEALEISDYILVRVCEDEHIIQRIDDEYVLWSPGEGLECFSNTYRVDMISLSDSFNVVDYLPREKVIQNLPSSYSLAHEDQNGEQFHTSFVNGWSLATIKCTCIQLFTSIDTTNCPEHGDK